MQQSTPLNTAHIRVHRIFHRVVKHILMPVMDWLFQHKATGTEVFDTIRPPYLIIGNHTSMWDPLIMQRFCPDMIQFVASDAQFRTRIMRLVLGLAGAIPKTKGVADRETVRHIMNARKRGYPIGIFAEGQSSWDGHSLPIVPSTAKLVRLLKIPVIVAETSGAYFTFPRWGRGFRRGGIHVHYRVGMTAAEVKALSSEEAEAKVQELIEHDEFAVQEDARRVYPSAVRAEYLERIISLCPDCMTIESMRSEGARLRCDSCGHQVYMNRFGFFEPEHGARHFRSIRDWNLWQCAALAGVIESRLASKPAAYLLSAPATIKTGYGAKVPRDIGHATLRLYAGELVMEWDDEWEPVDSPDDGAAARTRAVSERAAGEPDAIKRGTRTSLRISLSQLEGVNVQNFERIEFYFERRLYRIVFDSPRQSAHLWFRAIIEMTHRVALLAVTS